jgi:RND family efflux transporter MFP subunit
MNSSRAKKFFLPVGILLAGLIIFAILIKTRPAAPRRPASLSRPLVQVYEITADTVSVTVRGFGTVRAKRKISLVPQVSGVVVHKATNFEAGGFFNAGELLLRIDETDYRLAVERAAADVARAEYNLALAEEEAFVARREWEQIQSDNPTGIDTSSDEPHPLVFREPQLNLARAELEAARAALTRAKVDLERCVLKPSFTGRVLAADVDQGQYVRAGNTVGTIYATDIAQVTVPIPDSDLAWIDIPMTNSENASAVTNKTGSEAAIFAEFAGGLHQYSGRAVRLAGAVDDQSRMVPIVVEIQDPYRVQDGRPPLIEGMFVEVLIRGRDLASAVSIPRSALRTGDRVWVVDADEQLQIRDVTVARAGVEDAIIAAGLVPGEKVCVSSLQYVSNGMMVRVAAKPEAETANAETDLTASRGGDTP